MGISICGKFKQQNEKSISTLKSPTKKLSRAFTRLSKLASQAQEVQSAEEANNTCKIANIYKSFQIKSENKLNNNNENILSNIEKEADSSSLQNKKGEKNTNKDSNLNTNSHNLLNSKFIKIGKSLINQSPLKSRATVQTNNFTRSMGSALNYSNLNNNELSVLLSQQQGGASGLEFLKKRLMSEKIESIQKKYFISPDRILELYLFFMKIDNRNTRYISILDLYRLIDEHPTSSTIGPFLDRFFVLIEKRNFDKVSFEELLPNLLSFCLFSIYQVIEFVFHLIDKDHDNSISKQDIKYIMLLKREDNLIYYDNQIQALENYKFLKRSDKINSEEFISLCQKLPFIYYPAIKLQTLLKENFIGSAFWDKLGKEVKEKYMLNIKSLENEKIQNKIQLIRDKLIEERKQKIKEMMRNKEVKIYYQEMRMQRRNSDTNFFLVQEQNVMNGLQKDDDLGEAKSFDENIIEIKFDD